MHQIEIEYDNSVIDFYPRTVSEKKISNFLGDLSKKLFQTKKNTITIGNHYLSDIIADCEGMDIDLYLDLKSKKASKSDETPAIYKDNSGIFSEMNYYKKKRAQEILLNGDPRFGVIRI